MRTEALRGTVHGSSKREMVESAERIAAAFYGTGCVSVFLIEATVESESMTTYVEGQGLNLPVSFVSGFFAAEHHDVSPTERGFPKCRGCGRTNYSTSPLPRAEWEDWEE